MDAQKQQAWREAQRRCRLTDEDVRMAKELGFQPQSLIKNIPSPSQRWKAPVNEWVRSLYEEKIGCKKSRAPSAAAVPASRPHVVEFRDPDNPWPDHPKIPDLPPLEMDDEFDEENSPFNSRGEPPSDDDIDEQNSLLLRGQRLFRWAAQSIAIAASELTVVRKVAAFGAAALPLDMEVPRFRQYRRHSIEVFHECADLDLAIWLNGFEDLRSLKTAISRGLRVVQNTPYGGVASHQVDVHLFDASSGEYRGRLCVFGQCPKPKKRECLVPGCGAQPFLRQYAGYRFNPGRFDGEPKVILFDRETGFLIRMPQIGGQVREVRWREKQDVENPFFDDRDVPF
jgi:hypothetical protein